MTVLVSALGLAPGIRGRAQETNQIEELRRQLERVQENFERVVREQQAQIDALKRQIEAAKTNAPGAVGAPPAGPVAETLAGRAPNAQPPPEVVQPPWSPTQPIRLGGAQNYLNLSFDALFAAGGSTASDIDKLETGGHDPKGRGFTIQNLETVFDGKVDPYFRGQANVVLQIDPKGETTVEAEEAYLETMSLPLNLQVKAGQFCTEFGRLNSTHPHTWDFVDQPLVNGRFLGEDGLRSAGARVSWLAPTPFYSELFLTVANSVGSTAYSFRNDHGGRTFFGRPAADPGVKGFGDLLFVPRYAASFDLTEAQTVVAGASAAFGPNSSGGASDTQIYGLDLFWKWKSPRQSGGFPFVTWQTEGMMRRFDAGAFAGNSSIPALPAETLTDYGMYSQVSYGFRKGWVASVRGDYVFPEKRGLYENLVGTDLERASRWRLSPGLTYYPTEFSKIRLQYNYDQRDGIGQDHSVWLQAEFLLGSHAAHQF